MNQANFNWLFLSVWPGLRHQEIDNLHESDLWRVEIPLVGRNVFWIYQTKIIDLPPEDRWKPIPILYEEQEFAMRIIESGNFKRHRSLWRQKRIYGSHAFKRKYH